MRTSYTYALLKVNPSTLADIRARLTAAGQPPEERHPVDMHGLALVPDEGGEEGLTLHQWAIATQAAVRASGKSPHDQYRKLRVLRDALTLAMDEVADSLPREPTK